jgi:hypothetical protein
MEKQTLARLQPHFAPLAALFGVKEWAAIGLFAAAILFNLLSAAPAESRLAAIEKRLQVLDRRVATAADNSVVSLEQKLEQFYDFFRRDRDYTDWLAILYDMADRTGIQLKQGEYQYGGNNDDSQIVAYQVTFPLTGSYPQVRSFAEGVLNAIPIAALDQISFRRRSLNDLRLEADVRFTLFLRTR